MFNKRLGSHHLKEFAGSRFSRRSFLKAAALTASFGATGCSNALFSTRSQTRPNILYIIADDMGWADAGFHDSEIMTPNIDRLAKEGVTFRQHYVMATCSPTRCCLMTGRYASRFGVLAPTNEQVLPAGYPTLASLLKKAGYETFLSGKWHLGSSPDVGPYKYGFDHSYGSLAGGVTPYGHRYKIGPYSQTWHRNGTFVEEEGHVTDLIGRDVVTNVYTAATSSEPFFMYVPFTAPHHPLREEQKWLDLYEGKIQDESRKLYAACVTHMDAKIGEFLAALEQTGQRDNTIVIFTSDNGGEHGYHYQGRYPGIDESYSTPVEGLNVPLRGWKTGLFDGGIRVPAVISWPGTLKPGVVNPPVHVVDWLPTLCSVAGCELSDDLKLDGQNIWPCITDQKPCFEERVLYWRTPYQAAIRKGDWKLIALNLEKASFALFNLKNDPYEKVDLSERYPEIVKQMQILLAEEMSKDSTSPLQGVAAADPFFGHFV